MCAVGILVMLLSVGLASAGISGVGKCKTDLNGLSSFDFDAFSIENGGKWSYKMVPSDNDAVEMWLESKPEGIGKYRVTIYKQVGRGEARVNSDQIRESIGNGKVSAKSVSGPNSFELTYLQYVPGSYACFTICSDDGEQESDAVFVLSNSALTDDIKTDINNIVKNNNLDVTLKEI